MIKAFADILEAPGGLLLATDPAGAITTASSWNWPGKHPPAGELDRVRDFWSALESSGRIIELDALRNGWAKPADCVALPPQWMLEERRAWIGVPLIHGERLFGLILLAAPDYRRVLDWEDFDLLRTAGRQAASSLAEAHGQEALSNAQRFEEFNRRFAFILHDIKNLVSQLSLLSRNAERHADNPEFRADMVATLRSSVGKMNELLARLSPQAQARSQRSEPQPLRTILSDAIAAKRRDHEVKLLGDANLWAVVDATALEQAVGHLIQNAVEASSPEAPITVRVAPSGPGGPDHHHRSRHGHGRRLRPQPPVPALRVDQARRLRHRLVRSALADRRDGRPAGRRLDAGRRHRILHLTSPRLTRPRNRNGKSHDRPETPRAADRRGRRGPAAPAEMGLRRL